MLPKWHFLYGYVFSIILVYFFNFSLFAGLIVFLSSVFIDLDHVLIYIIKTRNLNPWKFYSWSMKRRAAWNFLTSEQRNDFKKPQFICHGIEFVLVLTLLSFLHIFFFWILLGVLLHLILDLSHLFYEKIYPPSLKLSQIWLWQRNKNKKEFNLE